MMSDATAPAPPDKRFYMPEWLFYYLPVIALTVVGLKWYIDLQDPTASPWVGIPWVLGGLFVLSSVVALWQNSRLPRLAEFAVVVAATCWHLGLFWICVHYEADVPGLWLNALLVVSMLWLVVVTRQRFLAAFLAGWVGSVLLQMTHFAAGEIMAQLLVWLVAERCAQSKGWWRAYAWLRGPAFICFIDGLLQLLQTEVSSDIHRIYVLALLLPFVLLCPRGGWSFGKVVAGATCALVAAVLLPVPKVWGGLVLVAVYTAVYAHQAVKSADRYRFNCAAVLVGYLLYYVLLIFMGFSPYNKVSIMLSPGFNLGAILMAVIIAELLRRVALRYLPPMQPLPRAELPAAPKGRGALLGMVGIQVACAGALCGFFAWEIATAPRIEVQSVVVDGWDHAELYPVEVLEVEPEGHMGRSLWWDQLWQKELNTYADNGRMKMSDDASQVVTADMLQPYALRPKPEDVTGSLELSPIDNSGSVAVFLKQERDGLWWINRVEVPESSEDVLREGEVRLPGSYVIHMDAIREDDRIVPMGTMKVYMGTRRPEGYTLSYPIAKQDALVLEKWLNDTWEHSCIAMEVALRRWNRPLVVKVSANHLPLDQVVEMLRRGETPPKWEPTE